MDLEQLLAEYAGMMAYVVGGILRDRQETEECLGEIRLKLAEEITSYDPRRGTEAAWLTAVCRNAALDRLRRLKRRRETAMPQEDILPDDAPGPEEQLLRRERAAALKTALDTLSREDVVLFYRKYYYLQPTARLAAELGTTERAVEGRLYRIRKKLQKQLGGDWR